MVFQALEYLQQLKESADGWKMCGVTLTNGGPQLDDKVKFVCLQVLITPFQLDIAMSRF